MPNDENMKTNVCALNPEIHWWGGAYVHLDTHQRHRLQVGKHGSSVEATLLLQRSSYTLDLVSSFCGGRCKKKVCLTQVISFLSSGFLLTFSCFNCTPCSLGLVLPPYSEDYLQADLSDVILQLQCEYTDFELSTAQKAFCCSIISPP